MAGNKPPDTQRNFGCWNAPTNTAKATEPRMSKQPTAFSRQLIKGAVTERCLYGTNDQSFEAFSTKLVAYLRSRRCDRSETGVVVRLARMTPTCQSGTSDFCSNGPDETRILQATAGCLAEQPVRGDQGRCAGFREEHEIHKLVGSPSGLGR